MDRLPALQDAAAIATNLTDANPTPEQDEALASLGLTRCPRSQLALQAVNTTCESGDEELAANNEEVEAGTEPVDLASNCIASLSICQQTSEDNSTSSSSRELEEQQLRPANQLPLGGSQPSVDDLDDFKLPKSYFCGYCNKIFHSVAYYCRHLRRHVNLWLCDKCNRGFKYFILKDHHQKLCLKMKRRQNKKKHYRLLKPPAPLYK